MNDRGASQRRELLGMNGMQSFIDSRIEQQDAQTISDDNFSIAFRRSDLNPMKPFFISNSNTPHSSSISSNSNNQNQSYLQPLQLLNNSSRPTTFTTNNNNHNNNINNISNEGSQSLLAMDISNTQLVNPPSETSFLQDKIKLLSAPLSSIAPTISTTMQQQFPNQFLNLAKADSQLIRGASPSSPSPQIITSEIEYSLDSFALKPNSSLNNVRPSQAKSIFALAPSTPALVSSMSTPALGAVPGSATIKQKQQPITPLNFSNSSLDQARRQNQKGFRGFASNDSHDFPIPTNPFRFFARSNLVKKFVNHLLSRTRSLIFKRMTEYQLTIIGDLSVDFPFLQSTGLIQSKEVHFESQWSRMRKNMMNSVLMNSMFIISPDSKFSIIWECLTMFAWIWVIFYTPFRINFLVQDLDDSDEEPSAKIFSIFIITLLIIETFVKLNQAIFKRGMIITDREQILKAYLHKEAILDFFILVIFSISHQLSSSGYFEYVLELRMIRIVKTAKQIFGRLDHQAKHLIMQRVVILVLTVLAFINLQGSIFVKLGIQSSISKGASDDSGTNSNDQTSNLDLYVAGLYWSTITMTTIGYGDIYPETTVGRVYVAIVSLISCGIFGYSISSIGEFVTEIQKESETFNLKMQALNSLLNSRQVSKKLKYKVINYHEYLHNEDDKSTEETGQSMIDMLPSSMKETVLKEMNFRLFNDQKIFSLNFSKDFLDSLSTKVKTMNIGHEIDLFNQGDVDQRLYFVNKGSIMLYFKQNEIIKKYATLEAGDMVGEIEFFSQCPRKFGAKSASIVSLFYIEFQDFFSTLQSFANDFERYSMMKDKIWQVGDLTQLDRKCESCGNFNHLFFQCNRLNYTPNFFKLVYESNRSPQQQRDSEHKRMKSRSPNAISNLFVNSVPIHEYFTVQTTYMHNAIDGDFDPQQQSSLSTAIKLSTNQFAQQQQQFMQQQQQQQQNQVHFEDINNETPPIDQIFKESMSQSQHINQSQLFPFSNQPRLKSKTAMERELSQRSRTRIARQKPQFKLELQLASDNSEKADKLSSLQQATSNLGSIMMLDRITNPHEGAQVYSQSQQQQQIGMGGNSYPSNSQIQSLSNIVSPRQSNIQVFKQDAQNSQQQQQQQQLYPPISSDGSNVRFSSLMAGIRSANHSSSKSSLEQSYSQQIHQRSVGIKHSGSIEQEGVAGGGGIQSAQTNNSVFELSHQSFGTGGLMQNYRAFNHATTAVPQKLESDTLIFDMNEQQQIQQLTPAMPQTQQEIPEGTLPIQMNSLWITNEFECARNYKIYYPRHNLEAIIALLKAKEAKLKKKRLRIKQQQLQQRGIGTPRCLGTPRKSPIQLDVDTFKGQTSVQL